MSLKTSRSLRVRLRSSHEWHRILRDLRREADLGRGGAFQTEAPGHKHKGAQRDNRCRILAWCTHAQLRADRDQPAPDDEKRDGTLKRPPPYTICTEKLNSSPTVISTSCNGDNSWRHLVFCQTFFAVTSEAWAQARRRWLRSPPHSGKRRREKPAVHAVFWKKI